MGFSWGELSGVPLASTRSRAPRGSQATEYAEEIPFQSEQAHDRRCCDRTRSTTGEVGVFNKLLSRQASCHSHPTPPTYYVWMYVGSHGSVPTKRNKLPGVSALQLNPARGHGGRSPPRILPTTLRSGENVLSVSVTRSQSGFNNRQDYVFCYAPNMTPINNALEDDGTPFRTIRFIHPLKHRETMRIKKRTEDGPTVKTNSRVLYPIAKPEGVPRAPLKFHPGNASSPPLIGPHTP